jgi:glutathione S-transferase
MEAMLDGSSWLLGGAYSLADIAAVPFIVRIAELAPDAFATAPRVADWWARVQQRPAYALACIERFDVALRARG